MPQALYRFGIDASNSFTKTTIPTRIHTAACITILWSSWCDLVYTTTDEPNTGTITYMGTSLTANQQLEFTSPTSKINLALSSPGCRLSFFGSAMHDGVRGYICDDKITIFGTPAEQAGLGDQYREIATWALPSPVAEVIMCSDGSLILAHKQGPNDTGGINTLPSLQALKEYCSKTADAEPERLATFTPTQLAANATTATALSSNGQVYTHSADPRYPFTLGRPPTNSSVFEPVLYLSELAIAKIASGGYMTAAISSEGELFLWSQANPGTKGELGVLHKLDYNQNPGPKDTVIWGDSEQDEYVKCLHVFINGTEAAVEDVAIGTGHILVTARDGRSERVVFAAGCGSEGQLGVGRTVEFVSEFEEVWALKGKRVIQMAAAGWSSFVVVEEGPNNVGSCSN